MQKEIIILAAAIIIAAASIVTGFTANVIKAVTIQQNHHAIIETDKGEIDILLFEDQNPVTTKNFITLVNRGFYNGLTFHRVVPGFVIQTGDPTGTGAGGPGYTIPDEYSNLTNVRGAVGMANTGSPNTGGSQFYILMEDAPWLNGRNPVFGQVVRGYDIVLKINQGDVVKSIKIV